MKIEEHKENLKKYIEEDFAFREPIKNMSDFDKYCYNHCQDIKEVLNELDKKDKVIDMMTEYIDKAYFDRERIEKWFEKNILPKDDFDLVDYKERYIRYPIIK